MLKAYPNMIQKGNIYLLPTPLGENDYKQVIPDYNIHILLEIEIFIIEELRTARRFLRKVGFKKDFETVTFHLLNEHTKPEEISNYLNEIANGRNIGLLSEAGCPSVADPGSQVVLLAHQKNIKVIPLVGPSSIILSLMASGLDGQHFTFHGYLPIKVIERNQKIKEIDRSLRTKSHTHIFIETPYRNKQMIESLLSSCIDSTRLCIASNITMSDESIVTKSISEWRRIKPDPGKKPTVYLLG
jgi:16S rRNA (cytidine1402-2'-O)-methyltransferase